jgi:hypothetical protein
MSGSLAAVTNASIRHGMGNRCFSKVGMAVHAGNVDVLTAAVAVHCTKGIFRTNYPITAQVDLSALAVLNSKGETSALVVAPAIAAGGATVTKVYILACNGTTAYIIEPEENTAGVTNNLEQLECPDGYAPFGAIKLVRVAGAAAFTLGTTALNATGVTATYSDLSICPALVADLA